MVVYVCTTVTRMDRSRAAQVGRGLGICQTFGRIYGDYCIMCVCIFGCIHTYTCVCVCNTVTCIDASRAAEVGRCYRKLPDVRRVYVDYSYICVYIRLHTYIHMCVCMQYRNLYRREPCGRRGAMLPETSRRSAGIG